METHYCPNCGAAVEPGTAYCPVCGTRLVNQAQQNASTVEYRYVVDNPVLDRAQLHPDWPRKNKTTAGILHILLGDIGVGNFYMGNIKLGILDVLFCWTGVPAIIGLIRGIIILTQSTEEFEEKNHVISD